MFDNIPENVGELLERPNRREIQVDKKKVAKKKGENSHPLAHRWKAWYYYVDADLNSGDLTKATTSHEEKFRMSLLDIFGTVEGFWRVYRKLEKPSQMVCGSCFQIFPEGEAPVESHSGGGKFSFIVINESRLDAIWERVLFTIVGGVLEATRPRLTANNSTSDTRLFSGVVFGRKKIGGRFVFRTRSMTIDMQCIRSVARIIRRLCTLPERTPLEYQGNVGTEYMQLSL